MGGDLTRGLSRVLGRGMPSGGGLSCPSSTWDSPLPATYVYPGRDLRELGTAQWRSRISLCLDKVQFIWNQLGGGWQPPLRIWVLAADTLHS